MVDRRYSKTHQWASMDDAGLVSVGITDFAQRALGDVVYVELPELGISLQQGSVAATIESVKTASDVETPATGHVVAVNAAINENPERINEQAEEVWLFKLAPAAVLELDVLMNEQVYLDFIARSE